MSDTSTFVGDALLNWIKGTTMPAVPAGLFVSLWNGDPDAAGTQVTGTVGLTVQAVTFGAVASRAMSNNADISFGTASGAATVTFVVLASANNYPTSGNQLTKKSITSTAISNGLVVKILSGNLTLSY